MTNQEILKQIFGQELDQQPSLLALRQFHSYTAYCENEAGEVIGICFSEQDIESIEFPKDLPFAHSLQYLNFSDNKSLHTLSFGEAYPNLFHLDASDCAITSLVFPAGFDALMDVYIQGNKFSEVIFEGDYPSMRLLDLSNNEALQAVPEDLIRFEALQYVYVYNSPILLGEENLKEARGNAWDKIKAYLSEFRKGTKPNYRAR